MDLPLDVDERYGDNDPRPDFDDPEAGDDPEAADDPESGLPTPDEPPARGRLAAHPFQIPPRGWLDVGSRVIEELALDKIALVAAGVSFYAALAIAPAFVALVSIYGLFASPADVQFLLHPMFQLVPEGGGRDLIRDLLEGAVAGAPESLTLRAVGGIALALWSANRGMKALITAIGLAYEEPSQRGLIAENLRSLAFVAVFVLVLGLTSLGFVALPHLLDGSVIAEGIGRVLAVLRWPVLFAAVIAGLSALYRWSPARRPASWGWISLGAVVATLCWLGFSTLFSLYSRYAGSLETGHAALDQVIALLLWFFLTAWAILLGAELNAELEHQTARDSTIGPPLPLGERGAFVADDIGKAR